MIMEKDRPAEMSPIVAPSFCTCLTFEFIKTVQREPRSAGCLARRAAWANSRMSYFRPVAKVSRKDPQPDEQASFSLMSARAPFLTVIAFIS